ncbi:MAG: hypothetical protein GC158_06450 [Cyanobacteria bacterium RI_101]|nr:hypothetical protein [Cyanobacteria bacterium RI_101]
MLNVLPLSFPNRPSSPETTFSFELTVPLMSSSLVSSPGVKTTVNPNGIIATRGTKGDDLIIGLDEHPRIEVLYGLEGNDQLFGGGGARNDLIGGLGNDFMDGGSASQRVIYESVSGNTNLTLTQTGPNAGTMVGQGNDTFVNIDRVELAGKENGGDNTFDGRDLIDIPVYFSGWGGNDTLLGGQADDFLSGGVGDDVINGGAGFNRIQEQLPYTNLDNTVITLVETSPFAGTMTGLGNDVFQKIHLIKLSTGNGATVWDGSQLVNIRVEFTGGSGNNRLLGGAANDSLNGGSGNDKLTGGAGKDRLVGGPGADAFIYAELTDSLLGGHDQIVDFNPNQDKIGVSALPTVFLNLGAANSLTSTAISQLLTSELFVAGAAAKFTFKNRPFIALNNGVNGFQAAEDAIIAATGLAGNLSAANFVIA